MRKTIYFLLLCVAGILFSCMEDDQNRLDDNHQNLEHHHNVKKTKVSFQEMKTFFEQYANQSLPFSLNTSFNKGGNEYITAIDSTNITQIVNDSITTFTLHINTMDDELYAFSNLIIKSYNGETEELILHYNPTSLWQSAFDSGEVLDYEGELSITDLDGNSIFQPNAEARNLNSSIECANLVTIYIPCYGQHCPCSGNGQYFMEVIVDEDCANNGGGTNPGGGSGSGGSGGSGGGGSGSGNGSGGSGSGGGGGGSGSGSGGSGSSGGGSGGGNGPVGPGTSTDPNPGNNTGSATHSEGFDQPFNNNFWSNPNIFFPPQELPTFNNFNSAYPKSANGGVMEPSDVYALIGGQVEQMATQNGWTMACAARVSRALNYSGVTIPQISGQTFLGGDNKYYFLGARNLFEWMKKTFGNPNISLNQNETGVDGIGFYNEAYGIGGIYIMIPNFPAQFGASGHADIFDGYDFNSNGYFDAQGGIHRTNLWSLN